MTKEITLRQSTVLSFVKEHITAKGYPPTIREIAAYLKITSLPAVDRHLTALEKKGYIKRKGGISRAIEVIGGAIMRDVRLVPIVGAVRAGELTLAAENIEGTIALDRSVVRWDDTFFLRVKGNSMIDAHIMDGDLALVRPDQDVCDGEIVVALIGEEATLKRFYKERNRIRLQPENKTMEPIYVHKDEPEFRIIGKVVGTFRMM